MRLKTDEEIRKDSERERFMIKVASYISIVALIINGANLIVLILILLTRR